MDRLKKNSSCQKLRLLIRSSEKIIVFTGAGISTESGIPDFRSKGGIWDQYRPVYFQEFLTSEEKRREYWKQKLELFEQFHDAQPNRGHKAIVRIHEMGRLKGVITQNIDGLHQLAGCPKEKIIEIHGTNRETICLSCQERKPWSEVYERLKKGDMAPRCVNCEGILKPNTISFGQALDSEILKTAWNWCEDTDLFITIGSTLVVEPAASLPQEAKLSGAKLVIINLTATPLDDTADLVICGKAGEVLEEAV